LSRKISDGDHPYAPGPQIRTENFRRRRRRIKNRSEIHRQPSRTAALRHHSRKFSVDESRQRLGLAPDGHQEVHRPRPAVGGSARPRPVQRRRPHRAHRRSTDRFDDQKERDRRSGASLFFFVTSVGAKYDRAMFVERKVCYSALFTNLVRWHARAVIFPIGDVILA